MEYISNTDFYELSLISSISDVDIDVVTELYEPLIGYKALAVYLTLAKDANKMDEDYIALHATLFNRMQISNGEFLSARQTLEAVGLLKTYFKKDSSGRYFNYTILSPKSPKAFFDDVLFKGLLVKYVGEKETNRLANKYKIYNDDISEYEDISTSFTDIFKLDYNDNAFLTKIGAKLSDRAIGKVDTGFDFNKFFNLLEEKYMITKQAFSKKLNKEIERIAALYSLDESVMVNLIGESYRSDLDKDHRIDFENVSRLAQKENKYSFLTKKPTRRKSEIHGDSLLANKVKLMESVSPYDYLRIKQNNTQPAPADMKIIDDISKNYGLNNGVINALVDFVLLKKDNQLSRSYIEKIAAQLARENLETTIDTMNYLNRPYTNKNKKKEVVEENKEENIDLESLISELNDK